MGTGSSWKKNKDEEENDAADDDDDDDEAKRGKYSGLAMGKHRVRW